MIILPKKSGVLFLILFLLVRFSNTVMSQTPVAEAGTVSGKIVDAADNRVIEFATVVLSKGNDTIPITGAVTDNKGAFIIESVPFGVYKMKVSFLGYQPAFIDSIILNEDKPRENTGNIKLVANTQKLNEVVVSGDQGVFQNEIDKKVFNVEKNIISEGGSAIDALKNIPSISISVKGKIKLRGSKNVTVLINGRLSGLTGASRAAILEQIPASSIERIEIISNPSAKYDADGTGGFINIVL